MNTEHRLISVLRDIVMASDYAIKTNGNQQQFTVLERLELQHKRRDRNTRTESSHARFYNIAIQPEIIL